MYSRSLPTSITSVLMGIVLLFGCLNLLTGQSLASYADEQKSVNVADPLGDVSSHLPCVDKPQIRSRSMEGQIQSTGKLLPFTRGLQPKLEKRGHSIFEDSKESIVLDSSAPKANVGDLMAVNAKKERDITCDEWQAGNAGDGLGNAMDLGINPDEEDTDDPYEFWIGGGSRAKVPGNYLNIEVRDISVTATNTVKGGSAVATSNIIIKPVQYFICPPEVEEKLK